MWQHYKYLYRWLHWMTSGSPFQPMWFYHSESHITDHFVWWWCLEPYSDDLSKSSLLGQGLKYRPIKKASVFQQSKRIWTRVHTETLPLIFVLDHSQTAYPPELILQLLNNRRETHLNHWLCSSVLGFHPCYWHFYLLWRHLTLNEKHKQM